MLYTLEYIWLDANGNTRSKTKLYNLVNDDTSITNDKLLIHLPIWNYDGSSTNQAKTNNSEVLLKPVKVVNDPFRRNTQSLTSGNIIGKLVLCETLNTDGTPHNSNTRNMATKVFQMESEHSLPMFGLEQEFFISKRVHTQLVPVSFGDSQCVPEPQGDYYCGVGGSNVYGRAYIEEILSKCLAAGLPLTGLNAEVAPAQWEFQVCSIGVDAADSLILLRYIGNRILEKHMLFFDIQSKPIKGDWNGSGCHINYSTNLMRAEGGFKYIETAMKNLSKNHALHIKHYGDDNYLRLTGNHETSSIDEFSYSVAGRHTSIRIPNSTKTNKCGYFEDRRPSSSLDPYKATALLHATSVGLSQSFWC